jgi:hypothetical protein
MVGVPGRSKGCNTCIQRKIKVRNYAAWFYVTRRFAYSTTSPQCDQETPLCRNCRKSNRLCTGYKRRLGYVLSRNVNVANPAEPLRDETSVTYQGRWRKTESQQAFIATYQAADPERAWTDRSPSSSLNRQISTFPTFRQQLHYIYLDYSLPTEMLNGSRPQSVVTRNWLLQLQDVVIQSPALEASIAAFFAAQVGRKNNDSDLIRQSRSMYVF